MSDPDKDADHAAALAIETIRRALIEGEQSGEPKRFDFGAWRRRKLRARNRAGSQA